MNKKILASIFVIGILALAMGWGTYSWFSDKETSTGNVFSAGKIDLAVWDGSVYKNPFSGVLVTLENMLPCEWAYKTVWIKNVGTREGDAWIHLDITNWGNGIPGYIDFDLKVAGGVIIHPDDHITLADIRSCWIPLGGLAKDAEMWIELSFHLKGETPNGYNGDSCTFLIDFYLNQPGAPPPPSNRILLENKDTNWKPIIGDGKWGIAEYSASDLKLTVWAYGLTALTEYQVKLTSPEVASWYPVDAKTRVAMASALASAKYDGTSPGTAPPSGFNLYERGYWKAGPNLESTYTEGAVGVWAFTKHGLTPSGVKTDANGYFKFEKTASLPNGDYSYIKLVVSLDDSPWTPALMECWIPMFFTIS
jgi:predicted ribosomally synthesized peptide with SipW-like signal peptide